MPHRVILLTVLTLTVTSASIGRVSAADAERPPNIVFILADDLGINDLGCYGRKEHRTPNLDKFAAAGTRFTDAYAAASICSPTRAAFLTGLSPARLHITTFMPGRADAPSQKLLHPQIAMAVPTDLKTLPECLKEAGYATGCFGKWHLGGKGSQPADHGFDVYGQASARTTPSETEGSKGEYSLTRQAIEFVVDNKDKPFFLYLPHNTPHIPYSSRADIAGRNEDAHEPEYAGVVETMDDSVGQLLAKLDELKIADSTLVVFTSDNGGLHVPELRHTKVTHNTPFRAGKGFLYEGGIRVPLIVRWPGHVPAGRVDATPVITTDWLATFAEIAGVKPPERQDGQSLAGLLTGSEKSPARPLFWHQPHYVNQGGRPSGAVRDGRWKFIEHYDTGVSELYDLSADKGETTDIAATNAERTAAMKLQLADWRKASGAQSMTPNPAFDPGLFQKLYVDVDPSTYNSSTASPAEFERMQEWRTLMDEVVRKR